MSLFCQWTALHKKNIFKISPYKVDQLMTSSRCCDNILRDILIDKLDQIYQTFSFVFELCCLCKGFSIFLKDIFKNLHQQSKKKSRTYINFGNDETQAQKFLIPTQKPNRFDHKRCKGRRILKFKFVFTINNGECDVRFQCHFVCLHVWIIYLA